MHDKVLTYKDQRLAFELVVECEDDTCRYRGQRRKGR
jgi:hypothetical protein